MKIESTDLYHVDMPLVTPFETSFGRETTRAGILVAVHGEGLTGWGECVASSGPWFSYETTETAWHLLRDFLAPALLGQDVHGPEDVPACYAAVRGHPMARAGLENAVWDLLARAAGLSLAQMLARASRVVPAGRAVPDRVPVGVSVGIEDTVAELVRRVAGYVGQGYGRVKLKIKPGWDLEPVQAVRARWPGLPLQVDANSAYTLADLEVFRALDDLDLLLIEQPLHHDDLVDHARLQAELETPICLDESIQSPEHARWALDLDACRVINIKVGRVGGMTAAVDIHDLCARRGVPVWCGGMLETNVGRAGNVALATLPNFTLPGDISASARYYYQDIAQPDFVLNPDSTVSLPAGPGLGVEVLAGRLAAVSQRHLRIA
jgi:O-succinylbenzoate synthase